MNITNDWLSAKVVEFIAVLNACLSETTFSEDRRLYAGDIAAATIWLTRLQEGEQAPLVAGEILQPITAKQFTDYWRQGRWGERESKALMDLQDSIRNRESM